MRVFYVSSEDAKEIDIENKIDVYLDLIGCRCFDIARRKVGGKYFDIYCDDEGLLKSVPRMTGYSVKDGFMLAGNLIFTQTNGEGDTIGITKDDVKLILENTVSMIDCDTMKPYPVVVMEY